LITGPRVGYKITCSDPGSEPAAEAAAALAAGSVVFAEEDAAYAQMLLKHARQLFDFADRCRGHFAEAAPFYRCGRFVFDGKGRGRG
jgi:endoglucanase